MLHCDLNKLQHGTIELSQDVDERARHDWK